MKRKPFRLGAVLKHYEMLRQRSELELHQATRRLHEIEAEIASIGNEITKLAALLADAAALLSTAGWLAGYRQSEQLGNELIAARQRRDQQVGVVQRLEQVRKRWAIAEESLLSLRRDLEEVNRIEAGKAQQLQLDETVLRQWNGVDESHA